jgi:hypothetical protein
VKRRVEAEHLLDPGGQQRRVFAQLPVHTRVVDQQRDAVADEVRGGLVAGCQQQCQLRDRAGNRQRRTICSAVVPASVIRSSAGLSRRPSTWAAR